MLTIHIHRLHTRYRLGAGAGGERGRLDRIRDLVLDHGLDRALERGHFSPREEVCIRRLEPSVRLRLSEPDWALADAWSLVVADAILRAGREADASASSSPRTEVVRYASREHALFDLALSVSRGDFRRAWAWRQLGLWPVDITRLGSTEASRQLARSLVREPRLLVPMLAALADRGLLAAATVGWGTEDWVAAAVAALKAVGSPLRAEDLDLGAPTGEQPSVNHPGSLPSVAVLIRGSRLAGALGRAALEPAVCGAISALILIETAPLVTRRRNATARALFEGVRAALRSAAGANQEPEESSADLQDHEDEWPVHLQRIGPDHTRLDGAKSGQAPGEHRWDEARSADPEIDAPPESRPRGRTTQGGLLFLLNVVDHLEIPDQLLNAFPSRPFRWVMHALALALAPVASNDPAALAFAGLGPGADMPDRGAEPIQEAELAVLNGFVQALRAEVQARLEQLELPSEAVLPFVCAREAEIVADPGWIEARFSLDAVSTDLRRGALDLDPGYLDWLGVVVRFVYE